MNELISVNDGIAVASQSEELRHAARELFDAFRSVFAAKNLRQRAIFWIEERRGKMVLRHVRNLERRQKSEDQLVGMTFPDINAAKVLIGNFADGLGLSTVRWELYSDFALTQRLDFGRFDHMDLLSSISAQDATGLASQDVLPSGQWDFDCILATHICPSCGKVFDRKFLIYCPLQQCETCGYVPTADNIIWVAKSIVRSRLWLKERMAIHSVVGECNNFPIINFANPVPNSFVYLFLALGPSGSNMLFGPLSVLDKAFKDVSQSLFLESLFALMRISFLREALHSLLESVGENIDDWEWMTNSLARLGESMQLSRTGENADLDIHYLRYALPVRLNDLIRTVNTWSQTKFLANTEGDNRYAANAN